MMLLCQPYFDLMPAVGRSSDEKTEAQSLCRLITTNDGQLSVSLYLEMGERHLNKAACISDVVSFYLIFSLILQWIYNYCILD